MQGGKHNILEGKDRILYRMPHRIMALIKGDEKAYNLRRS